MTGIHIALHDPAPDVKGAGTWIVGAFSTDEKAQAAVDATAREDAEAEGRPFAGLTWKDFEASAPDGGKYVIMLVDLDIPQS